MQINVDKLREMQRNPEKCRNILMTLITLITHENVIFDIPEPPAFRKYSTGWVLQKFEQLILRCCWISSRPEYTQLSKKGKNAKINQYDCLITNQNFWQLLPVPATS